jgi:glutathione-independent formaldehyde dehydrogenase
VVDCISSCTLDSARSALVSFRAGYNGALQAGVGVGSIVYIAGAGPVGLCCARSCFLLGAAEVFVADSQPHRLKLAASIGCKTIDLNKMSGGSHDSDSIMAEITRQLPAWKNGPHKIVDAAVDCVGYECSGVGREVDKHIDEQVLNTCFKVTKAGGKVGIPGLYPSQ